MTEWINIWKSFNAIYCINLISRKDRFTHIQKFFLKYKVPVIFYHPEKHPTSGIEGCFETHQNIIRMSYNKNHKKILIFEDDSIPTSRFTLKNMSKCIEFINTNKDWDLFFLGSTPKNIKPTNFSDIYNAKCMLAHAYIVNNKVMKTILNYKFTKAIDLFYQDDTTLNTYAFIPNIFHQKYTTSDLNFSPFRFIINSYLYQEYITYYAIYKIHIIFSFIFLFILIYFIIKKLNSSHQFQI